MRINVSMINGVFSIRTAYTKTASTERTKNVEAIAIDSISVFIVSPVVNERNTNGKAELLRSTVCEIKK